MNTRVLFFASLRDAVGTGEIDVDLEGPLSLDALIGRLADRLPAEGCMALAAENVRVAVNQTLTGKDPARAVRIEPGDEVAFLPPVTGG